MDEPEWLEKAAGYLDLGMLEEAWREIEALPPERRESPEALELCIAVKLDTGDLESALRLSEDLCRLNPESHAGFLQAAYCLHALARTEAAIRLLQSGPETLREEPVYFYNLACYELALGREQAALAWLERSFAMAPGFRARAASDPDLAGVHGRLPDGGGEGALGEAPQP